MSTPEVEEMRVCLVSDFFAPSLGGVETHLWCLARELAKRCSRVIILTTRLASCNGSYCIETCTDKLGPMQE